MTVASKPRSNEDWVSDLSSGEERREAALTELRTILMAGLRRSFYQLPSDGPPLEDFVQETLLRVLARVGIFRADSQFVTWAMSIAVRVAISDLRRARWHDVSLDQMMEAGHLDPTASGASVTAAHDAAQLMSVVRKAIEKDLTDKQRAAIQAELGGAPPDEIAKRLGTNRNALYKLVYDARARLKKAILSAGWSEEHVRGVLSARLQHE